MNFQMIDSHAHVQFAAYDEDREVVLQRAFDVGIGMVNVGTQFSTSQDAVALAGRYPNDPLWATVGFHPNHAGPQSYNDTDELHEPREEMFECEKFLDLAHNPKVVAVGECGLDYAYFARKRSARLQNGASAEASGEGGLPQAEIERRRKLQQDVFRQQIELAEAVDKPLVIHCRDAFVDLIQILDSCFKVHDSRRRGVIHFFSGSWEDARQLLDLGFYLGFGGVITFARDYDGVVIKAPLDRILVETDAPYVAPIPYRGKRNEPAYILETAKKIAELRGINFEEVTAKTTENARLLFGL